MKLDRRDLRLLDILARNCRISDASLGRTLGLSKDGITYRIKRLEDAQLIQSYVLFVDARRLGFTRHHLLIRFDGTIKDRAVLYKKIASHKFVMWMNSFVGKFDLQVIIDARTAFELQHVRDELFRMCDNRIRDYTILTHVSDFEFTNINPDIDLGTTLPDPTQIDEKAPRSFPVADSFTLFPYTKQDLKILRVLADEPRSGFSEIAREVNLDRQTVKSKLNALLKEKVILSFCAIPNLTKLGYVTYYLLIRHTPDAPRSALMKPFKQLKNIFYAGRMIGDYDMLLYMNAKTPHELNEAIGVFRQSVEQYILGYDLLVQDEVQYWRQFTPGIFEALSRRFGS